MSHFYVSDMCYCRKCYNFLCYTMLQFFSCYILSVIVPVEHTATYTTHLICCVTLYPRAALE